MGKCKSDALKESKLEDTIYHKERETQIRNEKMMKKG